MKTLINQLPIIAAILVVSISTGTYAQTASIDKISFVRVFNLEGEKIAKGKIISVNDSIIKLKRSGKIEIVPMRDIGSIKTKRSSGNNILVGAAIGAGAGAILGASYVDADAWVFGYDRGEGALAFGFLGALGGASIGGMTSALKNSVVYTISGDKDRWRIFVNDFNTTNLKD